MSQTNIIKTDKIGRYRVYINKPININQYIDSCMNATVAINKNPEFSRWSVRAILQEDHIFDIANKLSVLGDIELNKFNIKIMDQDHIFVWTSKNKPERNPSDIDISFHHKKIEDRYIFQEQYQNRHIDESFSIINNAINNKLSLVCLDPTKEWGDKGICKFSFSSLMKSYFYSDNEYCNFLLKNSGYSLWHYLFGIKDSLGNLLGTFIIAKWPWGFEGTYTIIKPHKEIIQMRLPKLLMLLSYALIIERHGDHHLIYGEANLSNMRACIESGCKIAKPSIINTGSSNIYTNVVFSDNPMGKYNQEIFDNPTLPPPYPPSYKECKYTNYSVMSVDTDLIKPFIRSAYEMLRIS